MKLAVIFFMVLTTSAMAETRTEIIDGKAVVVIAERNDNDGGIITSTCVPNADDSYYCHRAWRGRGVKQTDEDRPVEDVDAEKLAAQDDALVKHKALTIQELESKALLAPDAGGTLEGRVR